MQNRYSVTIVLLFAIFLACRSVDHLADTKAKTIKISNLIPDTSLLRLTLPYKAKMDAKMNEVIAVVNEVMSKGKPESSLTNWVADAIYNQAKKHFTEDISFAYQNYGGIRIPSLGIGELTVGKVFELMPFDNTLVIVKINSEELLKFTQYIADIEGGPISSNLRMVISNKKIESIILNGMPIEDTKEYSIAMPDYIANGGDNQSYLIDNERVDNNILLRSALIDEAREQKIIKAILDQRILIKNK